MPAASATADRRGVSDDARLIDRLDLGRGVARVHSGAMSPPSSAHAAVPLAAAEELPIILSVATHAFDRGTSKDVAACDARLVICKGFATNKRHTISIAGPRLSVQRQAVEVRGRLQRMVGRHSR